MIGGGRVEKDGQRRQTVVRKPRARMGALAIHGSIERSTVRYSLKTHVPAIQACFRSESKRSPQLAGTVDIAITTTFEGIQHPIDVAHRRPGDAAGFIECMRFELRELQLAMTA